MHAAVLALRTQLDELAPTLPPAAPAWRTGIEALDRSLGGGIPRGRLTELVGARAVGRTTLTRRVVAQVLAAGSWVAIVDATRTLAPQTWANLGARLVVIRPHAPGRAAWCADRLLRSGVFGLVVLDGAPVLPRPLTFRLSQLARDRDAALLVVGMGATATTGGGGGVRLRITAVSPHNETRPHNVRTRVTIEKGGAPSMVPLQRIVAITIRLRHTTTAADRRGAATRSRRPWNVATVSEK